MAVSWTVDITVVDRDRRELRVSGTRVDDVAQTTHHYAIRSWCVPGGTSDQDAANAAAQRLYDMYSADASAEAANDTLLGAIASLTETRLGVLEGS